MNRGRLFSLTRTYALLTACAMLTVLSATGRAADPTQKKDKSKASAPTSKINEDYTAKIKEYTTEKYFLTELVDHLPSSDKVPSPDKILGYVVGAPNKLTYTKDMYRYYRELEKSTPRVRVFTAPERSEEGREQMLVVVSDEANIARLDRYKEITARLADPRKINDTEAQQLIGEGKAIYWASGSIHSPEQGSPEMLMELAYRLAVEDSAIIEAIRKNMIVLITPALEVDGRDRSVDLYNYRKANPNKQTPPLLYWGKYVAHDNNRDGLGMALALSRNQMKTFLEYHPVVLHDLHESVPFLYTSTGTGPYNAWLDPLVIDEWHVLAYHEIEEMTKRGVPGVWTHGFYDGWAPNYMFYVANGHNSIGRFYETFGGQGADTSVRNVGAQSQRDWFRPNPPLPWVNWSIRNNINMQQSAILFAMNYVANQKDRFLNNFYIKSKRSVAKARNEGPFAWVIPGDTPRPVEAADTVNLLRLMGVEIQTATKEFSFKDQKFPVGSYIVRMDQPYSRMADMLFDTQYYNVNDPRPYDDTGWTLGALRNVRTVRVTDKSVLDVPMVLLTSDAKIRGKIAGSAATAGFIITLQDSREDRSSCPGDALVVSFISSEDPGGTLGPDRCVVARRATHRPGHEQRQQRPLRAAAALLREGRVGDSKRDAVAAQRVVEAQRHTPPVAGEPLRQRQLAGERRQDLALLDGLCAPAICVELRRGARGHPVIDGEPRRGVHAAAA